MNFHAKPGVYSSGNNKNSQVENNQMWRTYNSKTAMDILLEILQRIRLGDQQMKINEN